MKKKIIFISIAIMLAIMLFVLSGCGAKIDKESETDEIVSTENEINNYEKEVPKNQQEGSAGSNIPLKDNEEEAKYQIEVAMQYLFEEIYGADVFDARIYVDKIYTTEDEKEIQAVKDMKLGENEVAFEVSYELKLAQGVDPLKFTIPDGEYNEETEWVTGIQRVGVLRPNDSEDQKYKITDFGTGW